MKYLLLLCSLLFAASTQADDWTIHGSWTDSTPAGPEYNPIYSAECRVNSSAVYSDTALPAPAFTTTLTFGVTDTFDCRVRNSNQLGSIDGNWSAWMAGIPVAQPADPTSVILIQVH